MTRLKEDLVGGLERSNFGSGREYLLQRSLTIRNQDREEGFALFSEDVAWRWRMLIRSKRLTIPNKEICPQDKWPRVFNDFCISYSLTDYVIM